MAKNKHAKRKASHLFFFPQTRQSRHKQNEKVNYIKKSWIKNQTKTKKQLHAPHTSHTVSFTIPLSSPFASLASCKWSDPAVNHHGNLKTGTEAEERVEIIRRTATCPEWHLGLLPHTALAPSRSSIWMLLLVLAANPGKGKQCNDKEEYWDIPGPMCSTQKWLRPR